MLTLTLHLSTPPSPRPALPVRLRCLRTLQRTRLRVGLPESAPPRLRLILSVQEHGSPLQRIPPRPVIAPALSRPEVRRRMAEALSGAARAAWEANPSGIRSGFAAAGQAGADAIRSEIDAGLSPPNSPVTVSGGWLYNRAAGKVVYVPGKGFNRPLFNTGELYNAFDYEIKED